jgi:hypothetical protein
VLMVLSVQAAFKDRFSYFCWSLTPQTGGLV